MAALPKSSINTFADSFLKKNPVDYYLFQQIRAQLKADILNQLILKEDSDLRKLLDILQNNDEESFVQIEQLRKMINLTLVQLLNEMRNR